jgi:hypothetical protein
MYQARTQAPLEYIFGAQEAKVELLSLWIFLAVDIAPSDERFCLVIDPDIALPDSWTGTSGMAAPVQKAAGPSMDVDSSV